MSRKVALITGASRGIGKCCAIELAAAGYDIAITARTVTDGEVREHSNTVRVSDTSPVPGSLESTKALIEREGGEALVVPADLLDEASLGEAVAAVHKWKGRIDVVVHVARYTGQGHMDLFIDTPIDLLRKQIEANVIAPLIIDKLVIPGMIEQRSGTIINFTSAAAYGDPLRRAGEGGWGMGYGISKGALQRVCGFLDVELRDLGIRCFNLNPGATETEQMAHGIQKDYTPVFGWSAEKKASPMVVPAKVVRWLCTDPRADVYCGRSIEAQHFCKEHGLLPDWSGPTLKETDILRFDMSAYELQQMAMRLGA
jgi:NAD(P)-dependent dehydrogenase (short-subunit alcohol dehydrogenase family)